MKLKKLDLLFVFSIIATLIYVLLPVLEYANYVIAAGLIALLTLWTINKAKTKQTNIINKQNLIESNNQEDEYKNIISKLEEKVQTMKEEHDKEINSLIEENIVQEEKLNNVIDKLKKEAKTQEDIIDTQEKEIKTQKEKLNKEIDKLKGEAKVQEEIYNKEIKELKKQNEQSDNTIIKLKEIIDKNPAMKLKLEPNKLGVDIVDYLRLIEYMFRGKILIGKKKETIKIMCDLVGIEEKCYYNNLASGKNAEFYFQKEPLNMLIDGCYSFCDKYNIYIDEKKHL